MLLDRIVVLCPEVFARDGGIQMYSRMLIRGLEVIRPEARIDVFSRNDRPSVMPVDGRPGTRWYGCSGSNKRLLLSLAKAAIQEKCHLTISTFPGFAAFQVISRLLNGGHHWCAAHGIEVWRSNPAQLLALRGLQRLLPVSRFTRDFLSRKLGARCPSMSILPNSYDSIRFTPGKEFGNLRIKYNLRPASKVIFTLSRMLACEPLKNIDSIIVAMPRLLDTHPDAVLLIGGEGDDIPRLRSLSRSLGVDRHTIFAGRIPDCDLPSYYNMASVFVLPSEKEGFGIVFLEAMACGCPVIAGNRDGSVDPLVDGQLGLLVDPRQSLVDPLRRMLNKQGPSIWFDPFALSSAVNETFGFDSFCRRLDLLLLDFENRSQRV